MSSVIRVILIIIVVYYLIRFLDRYIIPYLFGKPDNKNKAKKEKKSRINGGEYVDYEEVD